MMKEITFINYKRPELSIILPCLNEEKAIGFCLDEIKQVIRENNLNAEIIVVDNGSTDNSRNIVKEKGADLVYEQKKGYGAAYLKGFESARGRYIFMADADASYDFKEIPRFLEYLKQNHDFVIGNRFNEKIEKGAMTWTHKYIGNPVLSGILRLFFRTKINDSHCGMRAINKRALDKLDVQTTGMEFASEMIVKAVKNKLSIKEVPIKYHRRKGDSKLSSFSDGWKHFRFMLLYSPLFLFFIPGLILFLLGLISMLWIYFGPAQIFGIKLFYHPMFLSALFIIIGYQLIIFALFAKTYSIVHLKEESPLMNQLYKYLTIERASLIGILISLMGLIIYLIVFLRWLNSGFGSLDEAKNSILALTFIIIGIQTIFSSFMLSILSIKEK